jgi:hypothetical protein
MTITAKKLFPPFSPQHLEAISKILADMETGLTGSQIGYLFQDSRIPDVDSMNTKWKRLFNAFVEFQNEHKVGNHVMVFITRAMNPASYTDRPDVFQLRPGPSQRRAGVLRHAARRGWQDSQGGQGRDD